MKNQKGITLIALIITIIVMLILTGIAISTLVSEDGVLVKTEEAKNKLEMAAIEEKLKLAIADQKIDELTSLNKKDSTMEEILSGKGNITSYSTYREFIKYLNKEIKNDYETEIDFFVYGDLYRISGELIGKELVWLATEIVTGEEFAVPDLEEIVELERMNVSTELGRTGTTEAFGKGEYEKYIFKKDMFFIDEKYNIYYMAENGDIITTEGVLEQGDMILKNPSDLLNPEDELEAYSGIYEALEAFTGDATYAKMVVENDLDPDSELNSFYMGGYIPFVLKQGDTVVKENLGALMINPDYSEQGIKLEDPLYLVEYNNGKYTMYKFEKNKTTNTNALYDKNGKVIYDNVISEVVNNTGEYNGYTYMKRFDERDVVIIGLPDQEKVDMQTDLANFDYNIKYWNNGINIETVKELILPDSIENMEMFALTRKMSGNYAIGDFTGMPNLEYIKLPANVKKIYGNAFDELRNLKEVVMPDNIETISSTAFSGLAQEIKVYFKNKDNVPSEYPWGGTNIILENK